MGTTQLDITALLGLLRRRLIAVVLCLLVGGAAGVYSWKQATPIYRSSTSVLLGLPGAQTTAEAAQGLQISSQLLQSYAQIVTSRSLAASVKEQLDLPESVNGVRSKLGASVQPQTLYIVVSAKDPDPFRAQSLADAATVALIERMEKLQEGRDRNTKVTATVLDGAERGSRISPRPKLAVGLGLSMGLLVGLLLALILDALDRTVKTAAQLHTLLGVPVLGVVPRARRRAPVSAPLENDISGEAYRALRTAVRFVNPDSQLSSFAPVEGDGKTTTAANLAIALAESGEEVVLVDGDLRRAGLAATLGIEGAVGLSDVIVGRAALDDVLQPWRDILTVLPAGTLPPNPSELLGSHAMAELLEELRSRYDVVVIDAPPALPVTDAVVLSAQLDGLVVVARAAKTPRATVTELRHRLDTVQAPVLGCVLNAAAATQLAYDDYQTRT
jgi:capsular exopolysaccharide synthesis family protein